MPVTSLDNKSLLNEFFESLLAISPGFLITGLGIPTEDVTRITEMYEELLSRLNK